MILDNLGVAPPHYPNCVDCEEEAKYRQRGRVFCGKCLEEKKEHLRRSIVGAVTLISACLDSDYDNLTDDQFERYFHNPSGEADGEYLEERRLLEDLDKLLRISIGEKQ